MHVDIVSSTTTTCLEYPHSNVKHGRIMTRLVVPETICLSRETNTLTSRSLCSDQYQSAFFKH
jgi:hypothetical protein